MESSFTHLLINEICICTPISNASLERLFNQMNIVKSMCEIGWQIQREMQYYALKFQKFQSILLIKITSFQKKKKKKKWLKKKMVKKKVCEWRKENANAVNVESQKFQNDPILTS